MITLKLKTWHESIEIWRARLKVRKKYGSKTDSKSSTYRQIDIEPNTHDADTLNSIELIHKYCFSDSKFGGA